MKQVHAQRLAAVFSAVVPAAVRVERPRPMVWRVAVEVDGVPLVFEDVDAACVFLVTRWW